MPREHRYDDALSIGLRQILQAVFGPDKWAERAAWSLGISRQQVHKLVLGRQRMKRRHWVMIQQLLDSQFERIKREEQDRIEEAHQTWKGSYSAMLNARRAMEVVNRRRPPPPPEEDPRTSLWRGY
jgi:hypothetical protein